MVESLAVGGELVPPLPTKEPLTVEIVDGRVTGHAGVNRFMGQIGEGKPFSRLATTLMAGPEELMAQEGILLRHLESVTNVESSESGMLLSSDGLIVVTLSPAGTGDDGSTS